MKRGGRGFTIIEVMLFLAVSSALFLIGLRYFSSSISESQFKDTNDQFLSFMQQQYISVKNVTSQKQASDVVCATIDPTGCAYYGKLLYFDSSKNTVYSAPIVGIPSQPDNAFFFSDRDSLQQSKLRVLADSSGKVIFTDSFVLPWGSSFSKMQYISTDNSVQNFNVMTIERNIRNEQIYVETIRDVQNPTNASSYNDDAGGIGNRLSYENNNFWGSANNDRPAAICIQYPNISNRAVTLTMPGVNNSDDNTGSGAAESLVGAIRNKTDLLVGTASSGVTCN